MIRLTYKQASLELVGNLSLIVNAFKYVQIDRINGDKQKKIHLETLKRIKAPEDLYNRRESKEGYLILIGNDFEDNSIQFLYFPNEEIVIGFSGYENERLGNKLAERLAQTLDLELARG